MRQWVKAKSFTSLALLKKARIGEMWLWRKQSATYWIHQIPLDRHMFGRACTSEVSGLRHWRICLKMAAAESNMECFWYNYTIINCLLTIFVQNYYTQPIYYTDVSKWCESLTDWSIPLKNTNFNQYHTLQCGVTSTCQLPSFIWNMYWHAKICLLCMHWHKYVIHLAEWSVDGSSRHGLLFQVWAQG